MSLLKMSELQAESAWTIKKGVHMSPKVADVYEHTILKLCLQITLSFYQYILL